jgi:hypothetical protein
VAVFNGQLTHCGATQLHDHWGVAPAKNMVNDQLFRGPTLLTFVQALFVGGTGILRDWNVMTVYDNWFFVTATFSGFLWLAGMLMLSRRTPQK